MSDNTTYAIGSYTEKLGHAPNACGEGIVIVSFNEDNGEWGETYTLKDLTNPSFLSWDNQNQHLYALTESNEGNGRIQAYKKNRDSTFSRTSIVTGPGKAGCHLALDFSHYSIYAASYVDGSIKGYHLVDGELGESIFLHTYKGSGPNKERQEKSHAHQIMAHPNNKFLYVCDLGSDRIWMHDRTKSEVSDNEALVIPPGYGPRHLAFDVNGEYAFILCELNPRLLVVKIDKNEGTFQIVQDLPTVKPENENVSAPAAVKVHPSGNSVAVSNRFDDTISVFQISRKNDDGEVSLEFRENFSTKGKTPRDITFSQSGKWLLIANQDSSDIQVKAFDDETGLSKDKWAEPLKTGTPICVIGLHD